MDELLNTQKVKQEIRDLYKQEKAKQPRQNEDIYAQMDPRNNEGYDITLGTGCTGTVCLMADDKLYFANSGDSRIIIVKSDTAIAMTTDHKPE